MWSDMVCEVCLLCGLKNELGLHFEVLMARLEGEATVYLGMENLGETAERLCLFMFLRKSPADKG